MQWQTVKLGLIALILCHECKQYGSVSNDSSKTSDSTIVANKTIMHFSDVHLNITKPITAAEKRIRYGFDATPALLKSALKYAYDELPRPDFFFYTGDHVAHGTFTNDYVAKALAQNVAMIENYFPAKGNAGVVSATAILGNTDGKPDYHMNVTDPATQKVNPSIKRVSDAWDDSLPTRMLQTFNQLGYLQYQIEEKLFVLTLNTVPYSPKHLPDTSDLEDPFNQFQWLRNSLLSFRNESKFAYIIGHIPPIIDSYGGDPQWDEKYIRTYQDIVTEFADIIKAQFFGHVHSIEYRLPLQSLQDEAVEKTGFEIVPLYISGSISPLFGNNPSFLVWTYDTSSYDILDYKVFGSEIRPKDPQLNWTLLFQASKEYNITSLSSSNMVELTTRLLEDSDLLESYFHNMKALAFKHLSCKDTPPCVAKIQCTLYWFSTAKEYDLCVQERSKTIGSIDSGYANPSDSNELTGKDKVGNDQTTSKSIDRSNNEFSISEVLYVTVIVTAVTIFGLVLILIGYKSIRDTAYMDRYQHTRYSRQL